MTGSSVSINAPTARGSRVRAGDVIATLEAPELSAQRSEAQSKIQAAEAQLAAARSKAEAQPQPAESGLLKRLSNHWVTAVVVTAVLVVAAREQPRLDQGQGDLPHGEAPGSAERAGAFFERGIDLAGRRSKHLSEFTGRRFDYVISLCDRVREICPEFPGTPQAIHWSVRDPAREPGTDDETLPAFERTAAELETRIGFLLEAIKQTTGTQEVIEHA
mgnify:CR=1 FL=1